jgi:hypothetical protein
VDIETNYWMDGLGIGVQFPAEEISLFSRPAALGPNQPPRHWATGCFFPRAKRPGTEADYSLPSSAEVNNGVAVTSSPIRLHGVAFN